jgi:biotin carboxyl carrier protein
MTYHARIDGTPITLDILARKPTLRLRIGNADHDIAETAGADGSFEITVDGKRFRGWRYADGDELHVRIDGRSFVVGLADDRTGAGSAAKAGGGIRAEMPGVVVDLCCCEGDIVRAGDILLTIESMKLQMAILAPRAGIVATLHVTANSSFERNALLVSLTAADE